MIPPIITIRTTRKKLLKEDDARAITYFDKVKQRHIVIIPYRASTKTRLHEIGHCELGHCIDYRDTLPIAMFIQREVDAEVWACEKCGKGITTSPILDIAHATINYGASVSSVFNGCIKALAKYNYKLDKEQKSELWQNCREWEKQRKQRNP